jgi:hypothetical protein
MVSKIEMQHYVAIDPIALLLPTDVYIDYTNWKHPNEPAITALGKVAKKMTAQQKNVACVQAKRYMEYAEAVLKIMG